MKNSLKLKEQRATLVEELQATVDLSSSEDRDFTEAEETRQAEIHEEVKALDGKISKAEETEQILLRNAAVAAPAAAEAKEIKQVRQRFSISKAMSDIINKGGLEGVEAEMCQEGRAEMARLGKSTRGNLTIPSMLMEGRANEAYGVNSDPDSDSTDELQGQGSHLKSKDVQGIVEGLRPTPVIERMGATRIQAQGDVVLPVLPNQAATETVEGANVANIDGDFSSVTLSPKRFAMRMDVTRQLLVQSAANLDSVIQADMSNAIANALDKDIIDDIYAQLIAGSKFSVGTGQAAVGDATSFADMVGLEGDFLGQDPAGANLALLMDPTMAAALKGVSQSAGGQILNVGNEILGYPVFTSTNVGNKTVVAKTYFSNVSDVNDTLACRPIMFLDPADIFFAVFGGLDVTVDPYTDAHKGQVRLIADYYADGAIRRAGSGRVLHGLTADTVPTTVS